MEILQGLLDNLTALLAAHPLAGEWYMAFVRFLFPALAVLILYRAGKIVELETGLLFQPGPRAHPHIAIAFRG